MPRLLLLLVLPLLGACGKDEDDTGSGDTDTDGDTTDTDTDVTVTETDTDTDVVETDTEPVEPVPGDPVDVASDVGAPDTGAILGWTGECTDVETFTGTYEVGGKTNGFAVLNLWETQAPDGQAWNEEHDVPLDGITLTRVVSPSDVGPDGAGGFGTLFGCAAGEQFDLANLTYALRIYDNQGRMLDCVVFGDDPTVVADGSYPTPGGAPSSPEELAGCRLAM